jgi:predicted RNA-binding Zn ribbon-like protein
VQGNSLQSEDVDTLNKVWSDAIRTLRFQSAPDGLALSWGPGDKLDGLLRPVAISAAELLMQPDLLARVGQCADAEGCGWLFLDLTKNRSRRWCDMRDCGNRAKARRFARRNART